MTSEAPQQDHVPVEELEVDGKYILVNSLDLPGEKQSISIQAGTPFTVLPAIEETTRNMPLEGGDVYYILDFNGVKLTIGIRTLKTVYIDRA